jgi:hypothetical protein
VQGFLLVASITERIVGGGVLMHGSGISPCMSPSLSWLSSGSVAPVQIYLHACLYPPTRVRT